MGLVVLALELLLLGYFGAVISALLYKYAPKLHPDRGILQATIFAVLSPSCLCASYPVLLTMSNRYLRSYTATLSALLSPYILVFSWRLLGWDFAFQRLALSILLAILIAFSTYRLAPTGISIKNTSSFPQKGPGIIALANSIFKLSLKPLLIAILISLTLARILDPNLIGKYALFPGTRTIAIILAGLGKFCYGQETFILYAIRGLPHNPGFRLGFSITASGLCLGMIPLYLKIYGKTGTAIFLLLTLLFALSLNWLT